MVSLRKASAYSKKKARPYTRKSGKKSKAYIKAVPPSKIVKFTMGNNKILQEGNHSFKVSLIAEEKVQIRDNALEACRMHINKQLDTAIPGEFYLRVKVYPHHILRENKTAAGAGADRLSSGMKHSFGITIGRAAMVPPGKEVFTVLSNSEKAARASRDALEVIKSKVPGRTRVIFQRLQVAH